MSDLLTRLPDDALDSVWLQVLHEHLAREVEDALPGQCLRLEDVSRRLLEALAARWSNPAAEVYLVDHDAGEETWRVGVHRVVALRNEGECVVVALLPPDVKLAAGDSIDVSTFRSIPTLNLWEEVEERLGRRLPSRLLEAAKRVLRELGDRGKVVSPSSRLRYLATIAQQPQPTLRTVGAALFQIGLIPDFELFSRSDRIGFRLGQRNLQNVVLLNTPERTPLDRLLRLPLTSDSFRQRLGALIDLVGDQGIAVWGDLVATTAEWRPLALEHWPFEDDAPSAEFVRVDLDQLKLPRRDDDLLWYDPTQRLTVAWTTQPRPGDAPDLAYFRIEIVDANQEVVSESDLIKAVAGKRAKRSKHLKNLDLPSGVYYLQVVPLTVHGDPIGEHPLRDPGQPDGKHTNQSDDFLVVETDDLGDDIPSAITSLGVGSYAEAEMRARFALVADGHDPRNVRAPERRWVTRLGHQSEVALASVQFDTRRQYKIRLSQRLRRLELAILEQPRVAGRRLVPLGPAPAAPIVTEPLHLPDDLAEARATVFAAVLTTRVETESSADSTHEERTAGAVVALADLCGLKDDIERYANAYAAWLESGDPTAPLLDVIIANAEGVGEVALVAPTHPLRLLWLLQRQQLAREWSSMAAWTPTLSGVNRLLEVWRLALPTSGLPPFVVVDELTGFVEAGELPGGWAAYLQPTVKDPRAALAIIQQRVGMPPLPPAAEPTAEVIAEKLRAFVRQHPYVGSLVVNVINPGDAALVVEALIKLEELLKDDFALRYELRLFSQPEDDPMLVGGELRALMDPDRQLSRWAARLVTPGQSPLFPKLTWSRKPLGDLIRQPDKFTAHVTLILDAFQADLGVGRVDPTERSSFVHGLVQSVPVRFDGQGSRYHWVRLPVPTACPELPGAPDRSALLARLLGALGSAQARMLAQSSGDDQVRAATKLGLDVKDQSLLHVAHAISTWVITIDPNLGLEYFDASDRRERPAYLLDFTPEFTASGRRQLLLTTRAGDELDRLMEPLVEQLGLDLDSQGSKLLIESMRALSGRLTLKLLESPSQAQGALGMALTKLFCEAYGLLDESIAIPLDAHPELSKGESGTGLRGDVLIVSADSEQRRLDLLVVETKCHRGAGLDASLRARISQQVTASAARFREDFEIRESNDRIDRQVQTWKLSTVLLFYLDRAERYGLITEQGRSTQRRFLTDLDHGYTLSVRNLGLVFRPEAAKTMLDTEDPDVPIWVVGRDVIDRLVTEGMRSITEEVDDPSEPPSVRRIMADQPTWDRVRSTFQGAPATPESRTEVAAQSRPDADGSAVALAPVDVSPPADADEHSTAAPGEPGGEGQTLAPSHTPADSAQHDAEPKQDEAAGTERDGPSFEVLLGETQPTPQYGLLGAVAAEEWKQVAVDLNGCNTISVFGVQGGGKSYTLGSVLEMTARSLRGINRLPQPLASVVFHYDQTQDYPPEFVSMVHPNDDPAQVQRLAKLGASPAALPDVLMLTTADMVDQRRIDFPGIRVEPIAFSSKELGVADWKFLMGASGNDSLYLKLLNEAMKRIGRSDLTLEAIRVGVASTRLTDAQRMLAETRLDFAARFIDDSRSLRSLLAPGRLVIVDLRDEFVERDEALGLFVTMLNVFAGAGMSPERFNKLIVFDEAHKYLGGPLIGQVVDVIRQMRHKGVSIVVASQDPINVPPEVIPLSSMVVLHRIDAPSWLKHIQKDLDALKSLTPSMLSGLAPGEAFVWSRKATSSVFTRRAMKLRMRPRVTRHGGSTRLAVEE